MIHLKIIGTLSLFYFFIFIILTFTQTFHSFPNRFTICPTIETKNPNRKNGYLFYHGLIETVCLISRTPIRGRSPRAPTQC
ncbi:hypothetical protein AMTRI_Chr08g204390 [Amborella trichopoda]